MTTNRIAREPAGVSSGGQFSTMAKDESDVTLVPQIYGEGDTYPGHTADDGTWCSFSGVKVTDLGRCPLGCVASGDGDGLYAPIEQLDDNDDQCSCGASLDDGEGFDGRCGNCADTWDQENSCESCDRQTVELTDGYCAGCATALG